MAERNPPGIGPADAFVEAVIHRDFDALESVLADAVRFRALTPRTIGEAATAAGARAVVEGWFADVDAIEVIDRRVETIAERLHLAYRLRLHEDGAWTEMEQHIIAVAAANRLTDVALLCSGFRPAPDPARAEEAAANAARPGARSGDPTRAGATAGDPTRAGAPVPDAQLDAVGATCATLTPRIGSAIRSLAPGQVLEVVADDPAAADGLRSWGRLTGHQLLAAIPGEAAVTHFYLRRA